MKKLFLVMAVLMVITTFGACNTDIAQPIATADVDASHTNQGIMVNTIGFERVNLEQLSDNIKSKVDESRAQQGYDVINVGDDMYLVVYAGERNTSGYAIEINSIVDNEGKTEIKVIETVPADDAQLLQVLTYPLDIVKLSSGISGNVALTFDKAE